MRPFALNLSVLFSCVVFVFILACGPPTGPDVDGVGEVYKTEDGSYRKINDSNVSQPCTAADMEKVRVYENVHGQIEAMSKGDRQSKESHCSRVEGGQQAAQDAAKAAATDVSKNVVKDAAKPPTGGGCPPPTPPPVPRPGGCCGH
ncbi:MAG: hypothetical protein PHV34_03165 [Verrucomicrobiae bacterium]|nr:hypothetical protein [Verrucomicrobiae bacterium]